MKNKVIIITGLPGTGKTTAAKALAKVTGGPHLNTDMIRTQLNLRGQYDAATKSRVYGELFARLAILLKEENVIIDGTFFRRELQDQLSNIISSSGAEALWVETNCPEELIRKRTSRKREYSEADFKVYLKIKSEYDAPLRALTVDTAESTPEEIASYILNHLS